MKHIKTIALVAMITNNCIYAVKAMGVEAVQEVRKLAEDVMPAVTVAAAGLGSQFGVGAVQMLLAAAAKTAAAAKATAVAVVASPAVPFVLAGAGVCVVSYGGYKIYRCYNPTAEQLAEIERQKAQVVQQKVATLKACQKKKAISKSRKFKKCLSQNQTAARAKTGVPIPCQQSALEHAMASGCDQLQSDLQTFTKFAAAA